VKGEGTVVTAEEREKMWSRSSFEVKANVVSMTYFKRMKKKMSFKIHVHFFFFYFYFNVMEPSINISKSINYINSIVY